MRAYWHTPSSRLPNCFKETLVWKYAPSFYNLECCEVLIWLICVSNMGLILFCLEWSVMHFFPCVASARFRVMASLDTPHSVGLLWISDRPVAETSTWQHTTLTRGKRQCFWRDSSPKSQQVSGRRPTSYRAATFCELRYWIKFVAA